VSEQSNNILYILLLAELYYADCFAVGDKVWSRSCSVRRKSSSRPMLAIGDNMATATTSGERGKKKRYSTCDGDSSRRSGSSSSSEKKQSASGDNDDSDSDQQRNSCVQGTLLYMSISA